VTDTLERVQRVVDFLEAHLFEDLPLATIADQGACSPWHFHRVFHSLTGETPAAYVWKRRLSEICRRLVETRQPLVDIALDCGFESERPRHAGTRQATTSRFLDACRKAECPRVSPWRRAFGDNLGTVELAWYRAHSTSNHRMTTPRRWS
jgi:AraC-like DNA-binding protein